jgi:hypothetical protein
MVPPLPRRAESHDDRVEVLKLVLADVEKERDRLRDARASWSARLGPLPASAVAQSWPKRQRDGSLWNAERAGLDVRNVRRLQGIRAGRRLASFSPARPRKSGVEGSNPSVGLAL